VRKFQGLDRLLLLPTILEDPGQLDVELRDPDDIGLVDVFEDLVNNLEPLEHDRLIAGKELLVLGEVIFDDLLLEPHLIDVVLLDDCLDHVLLPNKVRQLQQEIDLFLEELIPKIALQTAVPGFEEVLKGAEFEAKVEPGAELLLLGDHFLLFVGALELVECIENLENPFADVDSSIDFLREEDIIAVGQLDELLRSLAQVDWELIIAELGAHVS
jgi:hypothetical protein